MKRAAHVLGGALLAVVVPVVIGACSSSSGDDAPGGGGQCGAGCTTNPPGTGSPGADGGCCGDDGGGGGKDGSGGDDGGGGGPDGGGPEGGGGEAGTSCGGLAVTCGGGNDCCAASAVPGGTYDRSNDPSYPATISDFSLDVYEVTVGRFRAFVNAGKGTQASPPAPGDGAHPKIASSGWSSADDVNLLATTADLVAALKCNFPHGAYATWTDTPGANEAKPINCVSWWEAFAFCAWDGGRLPTEAEWNYAAAGGSEQRVYPFGATIDHTQATYDCPNFGGCSVANIASVGSHSPQGDAKWGHADMAGSMWEWTLDWDNGAQGYRLVPCVDCADLQKSFTGKKTFRGGGYLNDKDSEYTYLRLQEQPARQDDLGIRCAR